MLNLCLNLHKKYHFRAWIIYIIKNAVFLNIRPKFSDYREWIALIHVQVALCVYQIYYPYITMERFLHCSVCFIHGTIMVGSAYCTVRFGMFRKCSSTVNSGSPYIFTIITCNSENVVNLPICICLIICQGEQNY